MKLKKGIILNSHEGEFTVYDSITSTMHELNESAYYVVECIAKKMNQQKIVHLFAGKFDLSIDQSSEDVIQFLDLLKSREIIE